jgi:hypothetical protein
MTSKTERLYNFEGVNPFKDSQSRTFSDEKVIREFCPTSLYWSLFNDQHEVLIGTRGSGKTILLKMIRYSLLKQLDDENAKKIALEKNYIGIYVPMNLEFLGAFTHQEVPESQKLIFFQFAFNCSLAQAFLHELSAIIEDYDDPIQRAIIIRELAKKISHVWFPDADKERLVTLTDISDYINKMYYKKDVSIGTLEDTPISFKGTLCTPIQSVGSSVANVLQLKSDLRWLICIDEAEFLSESYLKCINTLFRSDSKGIIIKMATLPFRHTTKETLAPGVFAEANGNDFNYRIVDMKHDHHDFINVTNILCKKRLADAIPDFPSIKSLEDFLGKVGDDDLIDYYRKEIATSASRDDVESAIIASLSQTRQESALKSLGSPKNRKTIYDRFAPVFFCREMYKTSKTGNHVPGWYVGPRMVRRISQGNPRLFIQLMNDYFEYARNHHLNLKAQHRVAATFSNKIFESTKGLPLRGPLLHAILENVCNELHKRTHDNFIGDAGNAFLLSIEDLQNEQVIESIKVGIQYLRLSADHHAILDVISENSTLLISNCLSANFWLPMRKGSTPRLQSLPITKLYIPKRRKLVDTVQGSLF